MKFFAAYQVSCLIACLQGTVIHVSNENNGQRGQFLDKEKPLTVTDAPVGARSDSLERAMGHPGDDMKRCIERSKEMLPYPRRKRAAIQKVVDSCAIMKRADDGNYVCVHLKEGLMQSLQDVPSHKKVSAEQLCEASEYYMLALRGATRVPGVGSGPITNFVISDECPNTVGSAFAPKKELESSQVPDFWYAFCMNQECAHFLPSRTKWCSTSHQPTHSVEVCEAARKFMKDSMVVIDKPTMTSEQICQLYGDFVAEMSSDIAVYEHLMHDDSGKGIMPPPPSKRALGSSQMVNEAAENDLRDNSGGKIGGAQHAAHSGAKQGATLSLFGLFLATAASVTF